MKHKTAMITGKMLLAGILIYSFYGVGQSLASGNDENGEHDEGYRNSSAKQDPVYVEECGSCHMAYPARLLPTASWPLIMQGLDEHFGENAEVDETTRQALESYLAKASSARPYRKLFRNLGNRRPLRITELPYFIHEHDEIPSRFIQANDKVSSLSQCDACHQKAERGHFDEDNVFIPGVGRWDD